MGASDRLERHSMDRKRSGIALGQLELQLDKHLCPWVQHQAGLYEDGVLVVGVRTAYAKDCLKSAVCLVPAHGQQCRQSQSL